MARERGFRRWSYSGLTIPETEKIPFTAESAWAARHRRTRKPIEEQVVKIKCLDKFHNIKLAFPGRITLLDHPDKKGDITMMKLGGVKPECLTFLELWKASPNECAYTRKGVQRFVHAREAWRTMKRTNQAQYTDWLQIKIVDRLQARLLFLYEGLKAKLNKVYKAEEEHRSFSWNRYNHHMEVDKTDIRLKPLVHLSFREILSTPNQGGQKDESGS